MLQSTWAAWLETDPAYNPNLSLAHKSSAELASATIHPLTRLQSERLAASVAGCVAVPTAIRTQLKEELNQDPAHVPIARSQLVALPTLQALRDERLHRLDPVKRADLLAFFPTPRGVSDRDLDDGNVRFYELCREWSP